MTSSTQSVLSKSLVADGTHPKDDGFGLIDSRMNSITPLFHTRQSRTLAAMSSALQDGAIRTCSIVNASSFIKQLFPERLIFGNKQSRAHPSQETLSSYWENYMAAAGTWAWQDFLDQLHKPNNEKYIAAFLNYLTSRMGGFPANHWSANSSGKPAGGDAFRKPDLVCADIRSNDDWSEFKAVGEVKSGDFKEVYELLAERAAVLFRNQDCRRFVIVFALVKCELTVALFDRGGSIVSEPLNISTYPLLFLQFILGLTHTLPSSIGYDTSIRTEDDTRVLNSQYIPNVRLLCILHVAERTHGRGTIVWLAKAKDLPAKEVSEYIRKHVGDKWTVDPAVIVKDIWADEYTTLTEGMILALLNMKGVQGIPRIIAEERVSAPAKDEMPVDVLSEPEGDSTALIRSRLDLPSLVLAPKALKSAQRYSQPVVEGFQARAHVRSYQTPWAIPIFQFRSGVELLGTIADTLTSHEQAASSHFIARSGLFPFRFLHRDPSVLNLGMVPAKSSDLPLCPLRSKDEHRGLLYDWGFAKVVSVDEYGDDQVDMAADEDLDFIEASSDTDMGPRSTIHVPQEGRTDSGLYTATPQLINDFKTLVRLVRHCINEEEPALEITGTRPFMAIELLVASLVHSAENHPWKEDFQDLRHGVRHDLEAFYMVLVSLCLLYDRPHARKGLNEYSKPGASLLPEERVLPHCAVLWLTGQEELNMNNIRFRYLSLCTGDGFATMVVPYFSDYFTPVAPYLERIRKLLYGQNVWSKGPYKPDPMACPSYSAFRNTLFDAMKNIPSTSGGSQFAVIVEPPKDLYCPVSPDGEWEGNAWSRKKPFPMRSNNAFGFVEDQLPYQSSFPSQTPSTSTTEGYIKVPSLTESSSGTTLKTRGLRPGGRYALFPEVHRQLTHSIYRIKGASKVKTNKPYTVYSASRLRRRRKFWLQTRKGEGSGT